MAETGIETSVRLKQKFTDLSKNLREVLEEQGRPTEGSGEVVVYIEDYILPVLSLFLEPTPEDFTGQLKAAETPRAAMDILLAALGQSFVEAMEGFASASDALTPAIMRVVAPYQKAKAHSASNLADFDSAVTELAKNIINIKFMTKNQQAAGFSALEYIAQYLEDKKGYFSIPEILDALRSAYAEVMTPHSWAEELCTAINKRAVVLAETLPDTFTPAADTEVEATVEAEARDKQEEKHNLETKQLNRALTALYGGGHILPRHAEVSSATTYIEVTRDAEASGVWSQKEVTEADAMVRSQLKEENLETGEESTLRILLLRIALMVVKQFITKEKAEALAFEAVSALSKQLSAPAKKKLQDFVSKSAWSGLIAASEDAYALKNCRESLAKLAVAAGATKESTVYSIKKLQLTLVSAFPRGPKRAAVEKDFDQLSVAMDDMCRSPEFSYLSGKAAVEPLVAKELFDEAVKRVSGDSSVASVDEVSNHYGTRAGKAYKEVVNAKLDSDAFLDALSVLAEYDFNVPPLSSKPMSSPAWREEMSRVRQEVIKGISSGLRQEQKQNLVQSITQAELARDYDILLDAKAKTQVSRTPEGAVPYYLQKDFNVQDAFGPKDGPEVQKIITELQRGLTKTDGLVEQRKQLLYDIYVHWYAKISLKEDALRALVYEDPFIKVPRAPEVKTERSQPDTKDRGEMVPGVPGTRPELILAIAANFDSKTEINPETWGVIKHSSSPSLIDKYFSMLAANRTLDLPEDFTEFLNSVRKLVDTESKMAEVTQRLSRVSKTKFDTLPKEKATAIFREMQSLEASVAKYTSEWEGQLAKTIAAYPGMAETEVTRENLKASRDWLSKVLSGLIDKQVGMDTPIPSYIESTQGKAEGGDTSGTRITSALHIAFASIDEQLCDRVSNILTRTAKKVKAGEPYDKTGGLWELIDTDKKLRRKKMIHDAISGKDIELCEGRVGYTSLSGSLSAGCITGFANGKYTVKDDFTECSLEVYPSQIFQL